MNQKYSNKKTVKSYLNDVNEFLQYLRKEDIKVFQTKENDIKRYIIMLKENGMSNHTIARKNSSLRTYFKFLRKQGVMVHNPFEDIRQPRLEKRQVSLTEEEKSKLYAVLEEEKNKRDELIFRFMMEDKIKPAEMIQMAAKDYQKQQGIMYSPKRAVVISEKTKAALAEYIEGKEEKEFLFTNQHGKPLSESGIYFVIKNYLKTAELSNIRPIDLLK